MATPTPAALAPVTGAGLEDRMRAIVQSKWGNADVLHAAQIERPTIKDDEVLVQVHAAGLDRGTWHLMTGYPYAIRLAGFGFRRPKNPVPGFDVAGVVVGFGPKVTGFQPGDEVYGVGKGTFAEFTAAKAGKLARKPANLSFEQAAAAPVSGLTALKAVDDVAKVTKGQRVLIIGASGGVGSYAVQIAKARGAHVTGVASSSKLDLVRALGADDVLDYARDDITGGSALYDVILDIGGNTKVKRLRRVLTKTGTLVIVGGEHGGSWTGGMHRQLGALLRSMVSKQRLTTFVGKETTEGLQRLTVLIESGCVVPAVERTFPLNEAGAAMRHLESGKTRGKLVITAGGE